MKKYIMPDSLTNELWPFTCPWTSESVCGRILSNILLWAKIRLLPVLNLQNSHEEICYALFSLTNWTLTPHLSLTLRICVWKFCMFWKLWRSVTENTSRNPSPFLIYCSLIALNSSWPAVSSTTNRVKSMSVQSHEKVGQNYNHSTTITEKVSTTSKYYNQSEK